MSKQNDSRLTIKEIKHLEKCSDISLKVAVIGSIFGGITFLTECVAIGIITATDIGTLWKLVTGVLSTSFMGLGFATCEYSHYILKERAKLNNMLDDEKYKLYYEAREKGNRK